MIDFNNVTIPVYLSAFLHSMNGQEHMFVETTGRLLTCSFNIGSVEGAIVHPQFSEYLDRTGQRTYQYLNEVSQNGPEKAFEDIKRRHRQLMIQNQYLDIDFPQELTAQNAVRTDAQLCMLWSTRSSEHYTIPANTQQLARAFTASAHTGALVNIEVNKQALTSAISLYTPTKTATMHAKPKAGVK